MNTAVTEQGSMASTPMQRWTRSAQGPIQQLADNPDDPSPPPHHRSFSTETVECSSSLPSIQFRELSDNAAQSGSCHVSQHAAAASFRRCSSRFQGGAVALIAGSWGPVAADKLCTPGQRLYSAYAAVDGCERGMLCHVIAVRGYPSAGPSRAPGALSAPLSSCRAPKPSLLSLSATEDAPIAAAEGRAARGGCPGVGAAERE